MYILFLGTLLALGFWRILTGVRTGRRGRIWIGWLMITSAATLIGLLTFWADLLWYESLGFQHRFWLFVWARIAVIGFGMVIAAGPAVLLMRKCGHNLKRTIASLLALVGGLWGLFSWQPVLLYLNRVQTGLVDPILGLDTGFYLFILPVLDSLFWLALFVAVAVLVTVLFFREDGSGVISTKAPYDVPQAPLLIPTASLLLTLVLAYGVGIGVFHLLYSELGVVLGPGWTDVHVRLPALILMGTVLIISGALPLLAPFRAFMTRLAERWLPHRPPTLVAVIGAWLIIVLLGTTLIGAAPQLVQWLVVKPNEITFEKPYIAHNIEFTRRAFQLDQIEERQFGADTALTREAIDNNTHLLSEVRLWDWRALDAVYKQFQEIRLYYEFVDVDIDRYQIGDRYRQVMVSARELAQRNLPQQSQTFVNQRFKYTHGYGYTLAPVSDFTREGLPNLLVKNIPPVTSAPELAVDRPELYYGELTDEPVVVNTTEPEFDYPSGETNVYTRYQGSGGVRLSNLWRRLVFGWQFDGTVFLLSSYPTSDSRVLYHRRIQDRVRRIAPFLVFDQDPYIAAVDGRLVWIVDAYTSSSYFPYSQPFDSREQLDGTTTGDRTVHRLNGQNYVRNSVKAVVDAYDGNVDFYVFEADDPIIQAWQSALPGLFKPREEMPESIRAHVRYPQDLLLAQGLTFARYHMTDPEVFYNQEDLWVRATEKHYQEIKPVEPYYVMWEQPGSDKAEFVLILPFTPKNRQVLIGWIAALSDGENYGRFIAYKFPKERRVLGPQQVETKIDQDSFLSGQLTLWNQQGSEVIRGNVLAIPVDDSLLYVEPIYLRADTAAYPELRLVAVMQGDNLSYAETFEAALAGLFSDREPEFETDGRSLSELANQAQDAFTAYLSALGERRFDAAASALTHLQETLQRMTMTGTAEADEPTDTEHAIEPVEPGSQ
jgi:uncharacterized membrane protein (UPF0182 family)